MKKSEKALVILLRFVGFTALFALAAMVMPMSWMAAAHRWLGLGAMPTAPVVEYLARSVSAFYALVGALCLVVASDLQRYRPLVLFLVAAFALMSLVLLGIDLSAGMPWWWTISEGPPGVVFGTLMLFLARAIPTQPGTAAHPDESAPSLENLVEGLDLGEEVLHPGGLQTTRELAELCHIQNTSRVLDVASGTGEPLCFLAETLRCQAVGLDFSETMVRRAQKKALERHLAVEFHQGDAHDLPFDADTFDVAISECTLCLLGKERVIMEMARVVKHGGYVGFHDLLWKPTAPEQLKRRLFEIEKESPETLEGWKRLLEGAGLRDVVAVDESNLIPQWTHDFKKRLGVLGQLSAIWHILKRWGVRGLLRIRESERIFRSEHMGYCLMVGRKP
jgi:ubiquinone/menaquinone biosynthesis C-methylase UbiE